MPKLNKNATASKEQVRIIGGQWRGRKLHFPKQDNLRPTGDRIRETLFNWLAGICPAANCLDSFAGSGALGWEALSRGAASCTFLDTSAKAIAHLQHHAQLLQCEQATIVQQNSLQFLNHAATQQFDIVFIDPPFADTSAAQAVVELLIEQQWLSALAWIYIEQAANIDMPGHNQLKQYRHKRASQVQYALYQYMTK